MATDRTDADLQSLGRMAANMVQKGSVDGNVDSEAIPLPVLVNLGLEKLSAKEFEQVAEGFQLELAGR